MTRRPWPPSAGRRSACRRRRKTAGATTWSSSAAALPGPPRPCPPPASASRWRWCRTGPCWAATTAPRCASGSTAASICRPIRASGTSSPSLSPRQRAHVGPANTAEIYEDERRLALVRSEPNLTLLLEQRVNAVESADGVIRAVVAQHIRTARRLRLDGALVCRLHRRWRGRGVGRRGLTT